MHTLISCIKAPAKRHLFSTTTLVIAVFCNNCLAAEIDSFSARDAYPSDALSAINSELNRRFNNALKQANKAPSCQPKILYDALRYHLAGEQDKLVGNDIVSQLGQLPNIPTVLVQRKTSVYRDIPIWSGIDLYTGGLGATMRIDNFVIGTDKIGHFLAQGWQYFAETQVQHKGLDEMMHWGEQTEDSYYGFWTTGIYSHADLTANFNGYRFWQRIIAPVSDPLHQFHTPYLACENGQWVKQRNIDMADYIDGAWDEGNNCLEFSSQSIKKSVEENIALLSAHNKQQLNCPIQPQSCQHAVDKYQGYAKDLLQTKCLKQ
ncbi:hypothetical protein [Sinobacterium caligoides]|nr:hypothetical protein [Sinobacterium caligoides]